MTGQEQKKWNEITSVAWSPENSGDFITGTLINVRREVGKFKSNVYSIDNGKDIVDVFGSKVLDDKMRAITIGEEIKIEFAGVKTAEDGKTKYKDFKVFRCDA